MLYQCAALRLSLARRKIEREKASVFKAFRASNRKGNINPLCGCVKYTHFVWSQSAKFETLFFMIFYVSIAMKIPL